MLAWSFAKALLRASTGVAGPSRVAEGKETCLLSFSTTIRLESRYHALFMASYAYPAVMAPSPITETTLFFFPKRSLATAMTAIFIFYYKKMIIELRNFLLCISNLHLYNKGVKKEKRNVRSYTPRPADMLVELCPAPKAS